MADIRIEQDPDGGWHVAEQETAYREGTRVLHMDSGRYGTTTVCQTHSPITGRLHIEVVFDDGTRGVFAQRNLAPAPAV